jgi:adenylate cyclase
VQCAVAVQKELQARNAELPEDRRMRFRIGVNLGDVIEEGDRIYGDGVNIAARLESLADPGGICVSKTAFDHIESKLPLGYEFLGDQTVKNIAKPVGAYRVVLEPRVTRKKGPGFRVRGSGRRLALAVVLLAAVGVGLWQVFLKPPGPPPPVVEKADPSKMALPLPEQPSIAVLPFVNLSEDPKQQLLCDGITDNVINALSKVPLLFVIARNSTFTYKGKNVPAKQVSEELGVRYVLEGSVQRSDDRVRITAQMVDALNGSPVLSERFDGKAVDVFALQDEITLRVLTAVKVKLEGLGGSGWAHRYKGTQGLDCYLKFQEVSGFIQRGTVPDIKQARRVAESAIATCPESPGLYRSLGVVNYQEVILGASTSPRESLEKAEELVRKALAIDENNSDAHGNLGMIYMQQRKYDEAIASAERALSLQPGSSWCLYRLGVALSFAARPEEAIPLFGKALRLNPLAPATFYYDFGGALRTANRIEEATAAYKKASEKAPNWFWPHAALAAVYSMLGRDEEARAEAVEVLRINPRFSLEWVDRVAAYKDRAPVKKFIDVMRKAGLPDKPPPAQS